MIAGFLESTHWNRISNLICSIDIGSGAWCTGESIPIGISDQDRSTETRPVFRSEAREKKSWIDRRLIAGTVCRWARRRPHPRIEAPALEPHWIALDIWAGPSAPRLDRPRACAVARVCSAAPEPGDRLASRDLPLSLSGTATKFASPSCPGSWTDRGLASSHRPWSLALAQFALERPLACSRDPRLTPWSSAAIDLDLR
jgi:hypothetical protein